jgi:hypothetical protein
MGQEDNGEQERSEHNTYPTRVEAHRGVGPASGWHRSLRLRR